MAELADALDLGSSVLRRAGSIPVNRSRSPEFLYSKDRGFFLFGR